MDGERRAGLAENFQLLEFRHRRRLHAGAGDDHRLGDLRQCQLCGEPCGNPGKGRHARHHFVVDTERIEPPHLLGHRAIDRRIARMHPRHILTGFMGCFHIGNDLVEMHRRGVLDQRVFRRGVHDLFGHQRTGIQAHRAALDQLEPAYGDEVRRARSGADEIDGHAASPDICVPTCAIAVPSLRA